MSSEAVAMTVKDGYKVTEVGVIPEDWEVARFKDFTSIYRGASPRPIQDPKWFSYSSGIGWIRIADVTKSKKYLLETSQYLSSEGVSKSRLVDKDKLIMSICGTIGRPIIIKTPSCIHDGFIVFEELDKTKTQLEFLYYWLAYNEHYFQKQGQKGTQANINTDIVKITAIALPALPEQEKIAEILSTVDEHIGETEELIEKTETLKRGMMQKLLTQGIGHTEFKDTEIGCIPAEWEIEQLDECVEKIIGGGTPSREVEEYYQGDIPWVTVKDLDGSFQMSDAMEHITLEAVKNSATNFVPLESVVIATRMALGRGFINTKALAINQDLKALIPNKLVTPSFLLLYYLFIAKYIEAQGSGSTVKGIRLEFLKSLLIPIPSLSEQREIADILSAIDNQIEEYRSKLEALTRLKSGLMQQLLTGKIRVKV